MMDVQDTESVTGHHDLAKSVVVIYEDVLIQGSGIVDPSADATFLHHPTIWLT